jgi:hypothetical protein
MIGVITMSLSLALLGPPATEPSPVILPPPNQAERSRRLFIASGVVMGASLIGELTGAIVSSTCTLGSVCTLGSTYAWGSGDAGTRYTLITTGPGSAYVMSRAASIPLVWTGAGLLLAGAHARALADARGNERPPKRLAWALLGAGLGVYAASRVARLGFALGGVCQDPLCVYAFDQTTLGVSRGLSFSGSALVLYRRTHARVRLGIAPAASFGLAVIGQF